jgi:NitT/TauT family transport system permease protein
MTERLIAPPSRPRRAWLASRGVVVPVLTFVVLLLVWEGVVRAFAIPPFLLPSPTRISAELGKAWAHLPVNVAATLVTALSGFLLSVVIAIPLGVMIAASPAIARAIYPLLLVIQSTPIVAIAPILVVFLGTGHLSRMSVAFLIAFFPLLVATVTGLVATPRELVDLARVLRMGFWQELRFVKLPCAAPVIFGGLKVSISLSVIGAVVAEFVTANAGLGYLITQATAFFNQPLAFGSVILLSIMGIALFGLVIVAERLIAPWSQTTRN